MVGMDSKFTALELRFKRQKGPREGQEVLLSGIMLLFCVAWNP